MPSLVPRPFPPPVFDRILYAIKNWRRERPGNEASECHFLQLENKHKTRNRNLPPVRTKRRTQTVVMSLHTMKEGLLFKRGKINTEWRQRLFILNRKQLAYFKGSKHSPSGTIELKEIRSISDILEDGTFQIITPTRTYEIRGESRETTEAWITALKGAHRDLQGKLP